MEEQLAAYRARKAKEQSQLNSGNSSWFRSMSSSNKSNDNNDKADDVDDQKKDSAQQPTKTSSSLIRLPVFITNSRLGKFIRNDNSILTNTLILKVILWFSLLIFFIIIEFAAVYIVLSIFCLMYINMRGSRDSKRPGELSAYSVFNPNCERIDGTFTAEQFEKELRHGLGST